MQLARGGDVRRNCLGLRVAKRAIFQSTASMCVFLSASLTRRRLGPALTIHSVVRYSKPLFKNMSLRMRGVGPTVLGLATIPALPYIFDEPVEHAGVGQSPASLTRAALTEYGLPSNRSSSSLVRSSRSFTRKSSESIVHCTTRDRFTRLTAC